MLGAPFAHNEILQEIYDRGMRLYGEPKAQIWKQILSDAPTKMYQELGENMYLPPSWDEYFNISANEVMKQVFIGRAERSRNIVIYFRESMLFCNLSWRNRI